MAALTINNLDCYAGPDWLASLLLKTSRPGSKGFRKTANKLSSVPAPAAALGINTLYAELLTIASGGSATIVLSNYTDVLGQAAQAMVRLKMFHFWLVSNADRPDLVPSNTTYVTIGNAVSHPHPLELDGDGTATRSLYPGECVHWWSPSATGRAVTSGSADQVKIANQASGYSALVAVVLAGGLA